MSQDQEALKGSIVFAALGGNATSDKGSPREIMRLALAALGETFPDLRVSRFYQTPAFPKNSGPDFVNAACQFQSHLPPREILDIFHSLEAEFGRIRTRRWGQRTLDIDLIAHGDQILPDRATFDHWKTLPIDAQTTTTPDQLILPHPRLQDRPFVLVPLADVAPDWRHPVLGQTVSDMLGAFSPDDLAEIQAI